MQAQVQYNGFALLRGQTPTGGAPFDDDSVSAQVQAGLDWRPSPFLGAHVHLLARNDEDGSRRGRAGVVEAFLEQYFTIGSDRLRVMEGAFFLPTSRENIDSLWETPYTISSSALNAWWGEEFRPVGVDVAWRHPIGQTALTAGATVFRGNDTFGALPIDRGWDLSDRWTLLGEHIPVNEAGTLFTSVSAETDGRLGWSARAKWNDDRGAFQYTRIDNRSDALRYGELFNWATRFNIAGGDWSWGEWTALGEVGWGTTAIQGRRRRSSPIQASYLLLSRRIAGKYRASVRVDRTKAGSDEADAVTAALLWDVRPDLRGAVEASSWDGVRRVAVELRYRF
jgi:hypothetical protein